jgi:hypothetical protein
MESLSTANLFNLQYPTGKFQGKEEYTLDETLHSIGRLERLPDLYIELAGSIKNKPGNRYRAGGWTGLQVINHLVDVYLNAYLRTKWLLTEKNATLKPYDEKEFATLADSTYENIDDTLLLLKLMMKRFIFLLRSLPQESFDMSIYHPEYKANYSLHKLTDMYAWHGYHHLAHLEIIKGNS